MTRNYKIKEILKALLWMFGIPLVVAIVLYSTGAEIKVNEIAIEGYFAIPVFTFYLFCFEAGFLVIGAFIYGIYTGKIYE